jgi:hypothetical protein
MWYLIAAVVVVGLLCVLDLILTLGVIRRLREHTELLANMGGGGGPPAVAIGEEIGEFATFTVDGESLSREHLADDTLVAFLSPDCSPCHEKLPKIVEFARATRDRRDRVLAIVVGDADRADPFTAALRSVARVVVEGHDGALTAAFKTSIFPTLLRVASDENGRIVVTANHVELDQPATATV